MWHMLKHYHNSLLPWLNRNIYIWYSGVFLIGSGSGNSVLNFDLSLKGNCSEEKHLNVLYEVAKDGFEVLFFSAGCSDSLVPDNKDYNHVCPEWEPLADLWGGVLELNHFSHQNFMHTSPWLRLLIMHCIQQ